MIVVERLTLGRSRRRKSWSFIPRTSPIRIVTPTSSSQTPDRPLPADYGRSTQKKHRQQHVRFVRCYVNLALQRIHLTRQKKRGTLKVFLGVSVLLVCHYLLYGWDAKKVLKFFYSRFDFSLGVYFDLFFFCACLLGGRGNRYGGLCPVLPGGLIDCCERGGGERERGGLVRKGTGQDGMGWDRRKEGRN